MEKKGDAFKQHDKKKTFANIKKVLNNDNNN